MNCQFCGRPTAYYCDHILGWKRNRMMHTCDARLCEGCRTNVGFVSINGVDSIDKCPLHVGKEDAFLNVVITNAEAEAIRRRNRFVVTG